MGAIRKDRLLTVTLRNHHTVLVVEPDERYEAFHVTGPRCAGRPRDRVPVGATVHPLLAGAARWSRHATGSRWHVDETYVKVAGRWRYVYRAVDEYGQVIDVYVSSRRDAAAARRFFDRALATAVVEPGEVVTDRAAASTSACWNTGCQGRGTVPTGTPTIGSKPTTAN